MQEQALEEIKGYYQNWLEMSGMTEEDFLRFRMVSEFTVWKSETEQGATQISLHYGNVGEMIGLPFICPSKEQEQEFYYNVSLLCVYLAGRLDRENRLHPLPGSCQREDYFKDQVLTFLRKYPSGCFAD